jgi:hypothetical protein
MPKQSSYSHNDSLSDLFHNIAVLAELGDLKTAKEAANLYQEQLNPDPGKGKDAQPSQSDQNK